MSIGGQDELDALRYAAEMRAALANAGRDDLADRVWALMSPPGVPLRGRHNALIQAGYPFKTQRPGGTL